MYKNNTIHRKQKIMGSSSSSSGLSKERIDEKIKNAQDNADKIDYEKIREVGSFAGGVAGAYIGTEVAKKSNSSLLKIGSIMTGREIGSRYGGDVAENIVKSSIVGHERIIISHEVMRGKELKDFTTMDHFLFQMNDFGK